MHRNLAAKLNAFSYTTHFLYIVICNDLNSLYSLKKKKKVVLTHSSILILCILSRLFRLGYTTVLKLSMFLGLSTYTSEEQN